MVPPYSTWVPSSCLSIPRSGAASRGERVGSLGVPVSGSSVSTVVKPEPETVPWLEMLFTPAGMGGLFIKALKTMMRRLPAGSVPMLTETASFGAKRAEEEDAGDCKLLYAARITLAGLGPWPCDLSSIAYSTCLSWATINASGVDVSFDCMRLLLVVEPETTLPIARVGPVIAGGSRQTPLV